MFKRLPQFYEEPDVGYRVYRLHFNENLFLPEEYYRLILGDMESWEARFYTQPNNTSLAAKIEGHMGLPEGSVVITAGADDGLRIAVQLLHYAEERRLVVLEPTYSMPRILADQLGVEYVQLPYKPDLGLDVDEVVRRARGGAVYVCSPNNPTGHVVKELAELASRLDGLLIYDAAYAEFAGMWRPGLYEYGNVVEARTFSKAWGLAGLRVGYLVARRELASALKALAYPHPISSYSAKAVERALEHEDYVRRSVEEMREVRGRVASRLPLDKYVGEGNFITLKLNDAEGIAEALYRRGFAVRALGGRPLCRSCLRFTVAPMDVMEKFLAALGETIGIKLI
ncbi:MAG: pyridoxal phosphate-dependent aminotransferase [Thermoproteus sp.]